MAHTHKLIDGVRVDLTAEEIAALNTADAIENKKMADARVIYNNKEYQRNRAKEYPSVKDQLDKIYHSGIDEWKKVIKATKDKYPK